MTLINQNSSVTHTGNGVTTLWPYTFIIPDDDAVRVGLFTIATSVLETLDPSEYSITGVGDDAGGEVTYPLVGSPIASTQRLVIWREVPYTQDTELTNQTPYYPKVLEEQLDLIVMQVQQLAAESNRSIKVTLGSTLDPDEFVEELQAGAAAAAASAGAAAASASAASTSAGNAATSETNAAASASAADTSETNAAASEAAAAASASAAQTAETNAETAETNAEAAQAAAEAAAVTAATLIGGTVTEAVRHDIAQGLSAAQQGQARANIGFISGDRSPIINGDFDIWQRGTSFPQITGAFTADRWVTAYAGAGYTITHGRQLFTLGQTDVPGNPKYFYRVTNTTVGTISANILEQRIEGVRTFEGELVTLTFYMKGSSAFTLNTSVSSLIQSFGTGGSPSSSVNNVFDNFTVNDTAITTSWKKITVYGTLPSITGKTLGSNNNDHIRLYLSLPLTAGLSIDIAHVSLVPGDARLEADPFPKRSLQEEIANCMRYYEVGPETGLWTYVVAGGNYGWVREYKVRKRAAATVAAVTTSASGFDTSNPSIDNATTDNFRVYKTATSSGNSGIYNMTWTADAEL